MEDRVGSLGGPYDMVNTRNDRQFLQRSPSAGRFRGICAGVAIAPGDPFRLCRHVSRPPVASECLALTSSGPVRYALKTSCRDGTMHLVFEPLASCWRGWRRWCRRCACT